MLAIISMKTLLYIYIDRVITCLYICLSLKNNIFLNGPIATSSNEQIPLSHGWHFHFYKIWFMAHIFIGGMTNEYNKKGSTH